MPNTAAALSGRTVAPTNAAALLRMRTVAASAAAWRGASAAGTRVPAAAFAATAGIPQTDHVVKQASPPRGTTG